MGKRERTLEMCTGTALWYRSGYDPLPIRWVLTRDPLGKRPPKTIFSTAPTQTAGGIIKDFMKRWRLEVTDRVRAAPSWASIHSPSGRIEPLNAQPLCAVGSTAFQRLC